MHQQKLLAALKDIWSAPTRQEAEGRLARLMAMLRKPLPTVVEWLQETATATLSVFELPTAELRRRLRSTNSIGHRSCRDAPPDARHSDLSQRGEFAPPRHRARDRAQRTVA